MKLSKEVKTGIIVLAGILALVMGFSYLKSNSLFDKSRTFYAVYDHINGLQSGTQVTINGLAIGNVTNIGFLDSSGKLLVTFVVNNDFEFSRNSIVELFDTGIIGGKGLQIKQVMDGGAIAQSGDTLLTSHKPGLTELVQQKLTPLQNTVEGTFHDADSLLTNINSILDPKTKRNFQQSVANLNAMLNTFNGTASRLNRFLENNEQALDASVKNLVNVLDDVSIMTDSIKKAGLAGTLHEFQGTVNKLNNILDKMDNGQGSLGKLANDEKLYDNLADASHQLELLLQDFRLNPKRYVNVSVFGKKQKEYVLPQNDPALENKP